jgi:hypothetical protein
MVSAPTGTATAGWLAKTERRDDFYYRNANISASTRISMPAVISGIADRVGESESAIAGRML